MRRDRPLFATSFAADSTAPAEARRVVRELDVPEAPRQEAVLLTSEVVSNAVRHPGPQADGRVDVRALQRGNVLRIEVANRREPWGGERPPERAGWAVQSVAPVTPSGWGLELVDRLSARWGTVHQTDRTVVWFEVELDPSG